MAIRPSVNLVTVGGKPLPFVAEGEEHFRTLLKKWCTVTVHPLRDHNREPAATQVRKETEEALHYLGRQPGRRILLESRGRAFGSEGFAAFLQGRLALSHNIIFLVGGIRGFGEEINTAVDDRLSLSSLTFNHMIVRLVLMEQLFRAFSILNQTTYHR